jgi:hypothetical protein
MAGYIFASFRLLLVVSACVEPRGHGGDYIACQDPASVEQDRRTCMIGASFDLFCSAHRDSTVGSFREKLLRLSSVTLSIL